MLIESNVPVAKTTTLILFDLNLDLSVKKIVVVMIKMPKPVAAATCQLLICSRQVIILIRAQLRLVSRKV